MITKRFGIYEVVQGDNGLDIADTDTGEIVFVNKSEYAVNKIVEYYYKNGKRPQTYAENVLNKR